MISLLKPGTIVCAKYPDFEGKLVPGIFCVLYDEQLDASNNFKNNIIALKVSTSYNMITSYCVPLNDVRNTFFDKDCMALCSKPHVLEKDSVYKILGVLHPYTLRQVYKVYRRFETELERQMEDYI